MFLMRVQRHKNGKDHVYWALAESHRTPRGSRHRIVGWLGELKGGARAGWAELAREFNGKLPVLPQPTFFAPALPPVPAPEPVPEHVSIDVRRVRLEAPRDFGDVWLGLALWRALGLDAFLAEHLPRGHEGVPWALLATIEVLGRLCEPSSELHTAATWYPKTALPDLLGVPPEDVYDERLYRTLDALLPLKDALERHLSERLGALFGVERELCFYDVTSSYFEGDAARNPLAQRGYSRDGRRDRKQVCIGLVAGADGMPRGHEVFAGNRHDGPTLPARVDHMEAQYGPARRVWLFDRGIADEGNLAYIRERGGHYLVGTPRPTLRRVERELADPAGWRTGPSGVEVKLVADPAGGDTLVVCRSAERAAKEHAIHERFAGRIEAGLSRLQGRLAATKKPPDRARTERQLGRLLQKNARAAGKFRVQLDEDPARPGHLRLGWTHDEAWMAWAAASEGAYVLRTDLAERDAEALWRRYMGLTAVEAAFRILKSELRVRPIHHQSEGRVRAHVLVAFLAYVLWKVLEEWMEAAGLGSGVRTVLEECARIKACDVVLPTSGGREIRLRCVTRPDGAQRALLDRLGIEIPARLGEPSWEKRIES
jgi:hypothetical protein